MFDTHCHLNFKSFKKDLEGVVERAKSAGVRHILVPGSDIKNSRRAVEIAASFENVYAAVGIHPHHVFDLTSYSATDSVRNFPPSFAEATKGKPASAACPSKSRQEGRSGVGIPPISATCRDNVSDLEKLLLTNKKVVAIGEIGLDYHSYEKTKYGDYQITSEFKELQKELFTAQMRLAIKYNKSLILHNRQALRFGGQAVDDFLKIVSDNWDRKLESRTVFHCCEPDDKLLDFALKHKIYVGVDGDVTFSKEKQDFVKKIPLDLLVLETDSPFLLPEPLRSEKKYPNKPENIKIIGQFIADLLKIDFEKLAEITHKNSLRLFAI